MESTIKFFLVGMPNLKSTTHLLFHSKGFLLFIFFISKINVIHISEIIYFKHITIEIMNLFNTYNYSGWR